MSKLNTMILVSAETRLKAKEQAKRRGMTLKGYITFVIEQMEKKQNK